MNYQEQGHPLFLENSHSGVCKQIIWLIKNSRLNFQIKETPFSLGVSIKKRFVNQWESPQKFSNANVDPVLPFKSFPPRHKHQQHPHEQVQQPPNHLQENFILQKQVESLEAYYNEAKNENDDTLKNYAVLDKAFRKLTKENKELQKKHERTLLELKAFRNENETIEKHNN